VRTPQSATRTITVVAVPLLLAAVIAATAPASAAVAAAPRAGHASPAASFTTGGRLNGVAATSATNAWAVGATTSGKTLILHWNGTRWTQVTSPSPSSAKYGNDLSAVTATSASSAWAVGTLGTLPRQQGGDRSLERPGLEEGAKPKPTAKRAL